MLWRLRWDTTLAPASLDSEEPLENNVAECSQSHTQVHALALVTSLPRKQPKEINLNLKTK